MQAFSSLTSHHLLPIFPANSKANASKVNANDFLRCLVVSGAEDSLNGNTGDLVGIGVGSGTCDTKSVSELSTPVLGPVRRHSRLSSK